MGLGVHSVLRVLALMAVCRIIRYSLQRLLLIRSQKSKDLRVGRFVLVFLFCATGHLFFGELRDFCLLLVRQSQ
jgi:hypothetical protein